MNSSFDLRLIPPNDSKTAGAMDLPDRFLEVADEDKYSSDIDLEGSLQFKSDGSVIHPKRVKGKSKGYSSETDIEAVLNTPYYAQQHPLVRPSN